MCLDQRGAELVSIATAGTSAARMAHAFSSRLKLVEEALVGAFGQDLVGAPSDHARLVQEERIEAHRVLGILVSPLRYWISVSVWSA